MYLRATLKNAGGAECIAGIYVSTSCSSAAPVASRCSIAQPAVVAPWLGPESQEIRAGPQPGPTESSPSSLSLVLYLFFFSKAELFFLVLQIFSEQGDETNRSEGLKPSSLQAPMNCYIQSISSLKKVYTSAACGGGLDSSAATTWNHFGRLDIGRGPAGLVEKLQAEAIGCCSEPLLERRLT